MHEETHAMFKSIALTIVALTIATGFSDAASAADTGGFEPPKPRLEYMARFTVDLEAPVWELGKTADLGARRIIPITGGHFAGPLLNGEILNNGADWQAVTADGLAIIDTRYLLKADDGSLIYLQTKGFRYGPAEVLAEVARGNPVDPNKYSFRLTMTFETASQKYGWLNRAIGVGYAMRLGKAVIYDAYLVK
jgi:hypothetical protein